MSYCDDPRCSMGTHHHTVVRKEIGRDGVSYSDHIHRGDSEECGECKPAPMASEPKKPCTCWVEGCPDHATAPVSAPEAPSGFECEHTYVNSCCRRCGHTAPEAPKCKCRGGHACDLCDCACHSAQDAHAVGEVDWAAADRSMAFAADRLPNGFVSVGANEGRAYLALKAENATLKSSTATYALYLTIRDENATLRQSLAEAAKVLSDLMEQHPKRRGWTEPPGHSHSVPGIWDDDNGDKSGTACTWCATWWKARAILAKEKA